MRTIKQFAIKTEWEGGLDGMRAWCGGEAQTDSKHFNILWRKYVKLAEEIEAMLPIVDDEDVDEYFHGVYGDECDEEDESDLFEPTLRVY